MEIESKLHLVAGMTIGPYQLLMDSGFHSFLERCFIDSSEFELLAMRCLDTLRPLALAHRTESIGLFYDLKIPNPQGYTMAYQPCASSNGDIRMDSIIVVFQLPIDKQLAHFRKSLEGRPKSQQNDLFKSMTRGSVGLSLGHELAHAFGVNRNITEREMADQELDILADSVSGISAEIQFGDIVWTSTAYIHKQIPMTPSWDDFVVKARTFAYDQLKAMTHP